MDGNSFYIADRVSVETASNLVERLGLGAVEAAAERVLHYRGMGNAQRFCKWREIERLVMLLNVTQPFGTIH